MEILRRIAAEYGGRPPVTISALAAWADEEGARLVAAYWDLRPLQGRHFHEADRIRNDGGGMKMEDALRRAAWRVAKFPDGCEGTEERAAYIELPYRARPRCSSHRLPLAVVLGTKGVERHNIIFHGQEAHPARTPMNARRGRPLQLRQNSRWKIRPSPKKARRAVCTMGSVKTFPGICDRGRGAL